jgi:hypothetical protein
MASVAITANINMVVRLTPYPSPLMEEEGVGEPVEVGDDYELYFVTVGDDPQFYLEYG